MLGMTTTLSSTDVSDYNSRIALIEVRGVFPLNVMRAKPCTIKVPVSRLSQTLQIISRSGGKVQNVTIQSPNYGEVNCKVSSVSSPELRVVDIPNKTVTASEQLETTSEVAKVQHQQTEITSNQITSAAKADSDEHAANISGDGATLQLLPGLGVKLPKTTKTKTKKAAKKTAGKQQQKSKRKRKN
ncbi:MAG: hypothetical protein HRU34_01935 [Richelia sp.]|nr:hypothetical protein [Richelia sp.]